MRWEIIKKAWALASKKYSKVKRLYVDLPAQFHGAGQCNIIDLDKPDEPLGKIVYQAKCEDGKPLVQLSLQEETETAQLPRFASWNYRTPSEAQPLLKKASIHSKDILSQYPNPIELGEQLAYLIVGHDEGLMKFASGSEIYDEVLTAWMRKYEFPMSVLAHVKDKLDELGVVIAKRKKNIFENYEKVRIVDPRVRDYNEGGQVVGRKRDKDDNDWYQVIIDGSSKPVWLHEKQLAKNDVGIIGGISSIDKAASNQERLWKRGRPNGLPEVGAHGAIWGTTDEYLAQGYAGFEEGKITSFSIAPTAKILNTDSKFSLLAKLFGADEDDFAMMEDDGTVSLQMLNIIAPGTRAANEDQAMTMLDTMLADKLKTAGYDGAEMFYGETNLSDAPEIVIVNPSVIQWAKPDQPQPEVQNNERI